MKKSGLGKKILIAGIVVAAMILCAFVLFVGNLDSIVRNGIEKSLAYVLQVDVSLTKAEVSVTDGRIVLSDLRIANPDGYKSDEAFSFRRAEVAVEPASFKSDVPRIRVVSLTSPRITLEKGLKKSNLKQLIDNASRFGGGDSQVPAAAKESDGKAGKQLILDKVLVENSALRFASPILPTDLQLTLPTLEINDIGKKDESVSVAQAIDIFFRKIFLASLAVSQKALPADLAGALTGELQSVGETLAKAGEVFKGGADALQNAAKETGRMIGNTAAKGGEVLKNGANAGEETLKQGADTVKQGVGNATGAIKGIFGNKKE